jgi:hypothetical protein
MSSSPLRLAAFAWLLCAPALADEAPSDLIIANAGPLIGRTVAVTQRETAASTVGREKICCGFDKAAAGDSHT